MGEHKNSLSKAESYAATGEFWDSHDLADYWDQTEPAEFEVDLQSRVTYYAVDRLLSEKLVDLARQRGISASTLLNLWVQEKLHEQQLP
jgi:hypothetical protein